MKVEETNQYVITYKISARRGAKKRPFYRIVVADTRMPRDGRFIEKLGTYNPMLPKDDPARVVFVNERIEHWLSIGATPSTRIARMLAAADMRPAPEIRPQTKKTSLAQKH